MGIKFLCPNGHKLHVKSFLASQRGVCPTCGEKFIVPAQSLPDIRVESLGVKVSKRGESAPLASASPAGELASIRELPRSGRGGTRSPFTDLLEAGTSAGTVANETEPAPTPSPEPAPSAGAESDPLAEAPAALWYVRIASGEQFGPAQSDLLQRWLNEGRIAADALVWREGWAEWAVAENVFSQLAKPIGPPEILGNHLAAFEKGLAEHVESLVVPPPESELPAASRVAIDARPTTSAVLDSRRKAKSYNRLALIILLVAILCLLPVVVFVLFRQ